MKNYQQLFSDVNLVKQNGEFDFKYAFDWLMSIKDIYDVTDFIKDMLDIENLLSQNPQNHMAIFEKSEELKSKYPLEVSLINAYNKLKGFTIGNINNQEPIPDPKKQLQLFYQYLPIFALTKTGISKIFESRIKQELKRGGIYND